MGTHIKNVVHAQLTTTAVTLFTAPAGQAVLVKNIVLGNTTGSGVVYKLRWNRGATSRFIAPSQQTVPANSCIILEYDLVFEAGDFMDGWTASGTIDCVINAIARDV